MRSQWFCSNGNRWCRSPPAGMETNIEGLMWGCKWNVEMTHFSAMRNCCASRGRKNLFATTFKPLSSPSAPIKLANPSSPGKMAVKTDWERATSFRFHSADNVQITSALIIRNYQWYMFIKCGLPAVLGWVFFWGWR